jgi:ribosome assembly protein 4
MHVNPECTLFISSSKDETLKIWSRATISCLLTISAHTKSITKVLWSGEDLIYSCSEDTYIYVHDKNGNKV